MVNNEEYKKRALLVVAHGSRSQGPQNAFTEIIGEVREKTDYDCVAGAYLEFVQPGIPGEVKRLFELGMRTIVIVPYFLFAGAHVTRDIPAIIDELRNMYPDVTFVIADVLGNEPVLSDIIIKRAADAWPGI